MPRRYGSWNTTPRQRMPCPLVATGVLCCLLIGCAGDSEAPAPTAPPHQQTGLTTVAEILAQPEQYFGSEVRLLGRTTDVLSLAREYAFTDGTGTIKVDFGNRHVAEMNKEIYLSGRVQREFEGVEILVTEWDYALAT